MSMDWKSYARLFKESWAELEEEFRRNNLNPQHENDVVCYLYYALAKRLKRKRFPLHLIRTEDTHNIRKQMLRPDLNLNDRLFIEIKMYPLREYSRGWERKRSNIRYNVERLKQYVRHAKAKTPVRVRKPVLALWFRKRDKLLELPIEQVLIPEDLEHRIEDEVVKYKDRVTIVYGPKRK